MFNIHARRRQKVHDKKVCGGNGVRGVYQVVVNGREEGMGWGGIYPSIVIGYIVEGGGTLSYRP